MGAPGADSSAWERAGATWWIVDFPDPVAVGTVADVIADGPG
jgi:hypothetical protein